MLGEGQTFFDPDFTRPLDAERLLKKIPDTATVKGIFVDGLEKLVARRVEDGKKRLYEGLVRDRYIGFKSYPRSEIMRIELRSAELLYPDLPVRDGIRHAAREVYRIFLESLIGRTIFGVLGNDVQKALKLGPKGNGLVANFGVVVNEVLGDQHMRFHYKDYYSWLDCGDLGVIEGAILHYGFEPEIKIARGEAFEIFFDVRWSLSGSRPSGESAPS